jgi:pyruvate-ferredoxin/flavodoxin oxidoreductase
VRPTGAFSLRGHSIGGYGSITTNKLVAQLAADLFRLHVQAFPKYGSEKKGLPTSYYLTLAPEPIRLHSELEQVEFVIANEPRALATGDALRGLVDGGTLVLQIPAETAEAAWESIPPAARCAIRARRLRVLSIDAAAIARSVATSPDLVVRMQGIVQLGVFLRAAPFVAQAGLGREALLARVEEYLRSKFGRRGEHVVQENLTCVRRGYDEVMEIPEALVAEEAAKKEALS